MKKSLLVIFILLFLSAPSFAFAAVAGDLDGNGSITLEDIAYFMAWFMKGRTTDQQLVVTTAKTLYANALGPIVRLPSASSDNFYGDNLVGLNDIAIMMAFFMKGRSTDFGVVQPQAITLYPSANFIHKLPGTLIGDSTIPVTINGIQVDP